MAKVKEPWSTTKKLIMVFVTALYGVSPIDIIPDVIPVVGWLDDVALIIYTFVNICRSSPYVCQSVKDKVAASKAQKFHNAVEVANTISQTVPEGVAPRFKQVVNLANTADKAIQEVQQVQPQDINTNPME